MLNQFRTEEYDSSLDAGIWNSRQKDIYLYGFRNNIYCFRLGEKQVRKPPLVSVWGLFFMIKLYLDSGANKRIYCFVWANI